MEWNNAKKHKINPAEALSWHHKQDKYKTSWKSLGKFGVWDLWRHGDKVMAVHKNGFDAVVSRDEVPEMRALCEHVGDKTKTKVALPILVNNNPSQLDFSHYIPRYRPTVVTANQATKEIAHGAAGITSEKLALENVGIVAMGMKAAMLKLPPSYRSAALQMLNDDFNVDF